MPYPNGITLDADFTGGAIPSGWTFARASVATDGLFTDAAGSGYNAVATGVARFRGATGWIFEGQARTNFLLNSAAPATQTTGTLAAAGHVLWVIGTGSATVTAGTGAATGLGTATAGNPLYFTVTTPGTFVVTVTGTLNRFQLERGGSPTSFIVTAGATATRAAETCFQATGAWFNAAAGTLALQFQMPLVITNTNGVGVLSLDDATVNNRITLAQNPSAQLLVSAGGVTQVNTTVPQSVIAGAPMRMAARYSSTDIKLAAMGLLGIVQTGKTIPTVNRIEFVPGAGGQLGATLMIQRAHYWPFAMSDADLTGAGQYPPQAQLTAWGAGFGFGLASSRARVRPSFVGSGMGSGRATLSSFSIARIGAAGIGLSSGGIARPSIVVAPPPRVVVAPPDVTVVGYDTLLLDRDLWDLVVDAYGNIAAAQAPYALEQDVASAVRLFLGELWYDTASGVPYFEQVLGKSPPLPLLKSLIEQAALRVPRVARARAFVTEARDRTVTGQIQITTADGQQLTLTETFLGRVPSS